MARQELSPDVEHPGKTLFTLKMTLDEGESPQGHDISGAIAPIEVAEHASLKHHLLGPSLTKAGQDSVDQQQVFLDMPLYPWS